MRIGGLIPVFAGLLISSPALAQDWLEYVNMDERFAVNLPAEPVMTEGTFRSASGAMLPAHVFTTVDGESTYTVTVVSYAGVDAGEYDAALDHAVETLRARDGEITSENSASYEGMASRMLQITNPDQTRSFIAITLPPPISHLDRLYIIEGRRPASLPPPGQFQQSLSFRDADGVRMRYGTDIDGNKFRVIGETCGFPYRRKGEKGLSLCDY